MLVERGLGDQAGEFRRASGHFAAQLYKEDIEAALRTPGLAGFQLLELHDFPGQGEALVGLLDSFWDSKGLITPGGFRSFCGPTVPLLRLGKFVWTNGETLRATAEIAHHGPAPLENVTITWSVRDDNGSVSASGVFGHISLPLGVTALGKIQVPLESVRQAGHGRITLSIPSNAVSNHWDIWVYPGTVDTSIPPDVIVSDAFDASVRQALASGKKVLLLKRGSGNNSRMLQNQFLPVFWSLKWASGQPGTMGVSCDPAHPALAGFPTDYCSDWQWWEITQNSKCFILDDTPADFHPIIWIIDDFHRNHKLGAMFETRVGPGRLLVCSFDLESNLNKRPVARQIRSSLLSYMAGSRFDPKIELAPGLLDKLLGSNPARSSANP
ncbi:MAG: hypothetical protein M1608_18280 [Candidatus Omnitrophica bacterium]|nr:hypothetical protein [Candidatus Omnitrophota bacterium]